MPAPIPYADREEIIRRKQEGQTLGAIAQALGYSYWGVRKIWRQYRERGKAGLKTAYRRGPGPIRKREAVYQQALALKRAHPGWGAGLIRSVLLEQWPEEEVPSERTLQRWWRRAGLSPPAPRQVRERWGQAKKVHEVWQMDGVEVAVGSWVTVTDEKSGAVLGSRLFPLSASGADTAASDSGVSPGGDDGMGTSAGAAGG